MTEKRFVDYFDKEHNYIIQDLVNEDEYQVGYANCDEDMFLKLVNAIAETSCDCITDCEIVVRKLKEENEELKSDYSEQCIQLDFLKAENSHMKQVLEENEQLKQSMFKWRKSSQYWSKEHSELEKENEQLKKELKELHEICAYYEDRIKELKGDVE